MKYKKAHIKTASKIMVAFILYFKTINTKLNKKIKKIYIHLN